MQASIRKPLIAAILCMIFWGAQLNAQDPFHFLIGENQLAGVEIYSITQAKDKTYWIASDNGIIKYDGYSFKKIATIGLLGNSVFDFNESSAGLFCKNLSGQIIQIEKDTARVYFQIPDQLMSTDFDYFFDQSGVLHVLGYSFFKVGTNKEVIQIINQKEVKGSFKDAFKLDESTFIFQKPGAAEMYLYQNGKILKERISIPFIEHNYIFFHFNNQPTILDRVNGEMGVISNKKYIPSKTITTEKNTPVSSKFFSSNEYFWLTSPKNGATVIDVNYNSIFNNKPIFTDQFISCVYQDLEGNYLLGTFGSGIIIVPDLNSIELRLPKKTIKINKITSNEKDIIYAGTQNGQIYSLDNSNSIQLLTKKDLGNVRYLKHLTANNQLLINGVITSPDQLDISNVSTFITGSIKDVEYYGDSKYVIALNSGVQLLDISNGSKPTFYGNYRERAYCANYNPVSNTMYAGTTKGLKIGNKEKSFYFTLDSTPLLCNDIKIIKDKIYVSTQSYGILVFKGTNKVEALNQSTGLISNNTKQIKFKDGRLYIVTDKGFQILNQKGEVLYTLSKADGISVNKIIDFEIVNQTLWIAYQNGFHPVNLKELQPFNFKPTISISSVFLNENPVSIHSKNASFDHLNRKIRFELSSKVLKYRDDVRYQYILEGLDNSWSENNYADNVIEYKSLTPGEYTFKVKSICRNAKSETQQFFFTITKPFWKRWWFIALGIFLTGLIIWLIYKAQLKKQLKETRLKNELMSTKLTAIKSQMNPHFIFNSLNSIQDLVLQQDANNAYNYIGKFAKLVRKILHHSDLDYVDFTEELEIISLYVELEKLRFKKNFEYQIEARGIDDIEIPPMLIQPYIENAIKHGLLHKKGLKELQIVFKLEEEYLNCMIKDNGVGRTKSKEINTRQKKDHASFSLASLDHRYTILGTDSTTNFGATFIDLMDEQNNPTGTQVSLKIPYHRKF